MDQLFLGSPNRSPWKTGTKPYFICAHQCLATWNSVDLVYLTQIHHRNSQCNHEAEVATLMKCTTVTVQQYARDKKCQTRLKPMDLSAYYAAFTEWTSAVTHCHCDLSIPQKQEAQTLKMGSCGACAPKDCGALGCWMRLQTRNEVTKSFPVSKSPGLWPSLNSLVSTPIQSHPAAHQLYNEEWQRSQFITIV